MDKRKGLFQNRSKALFLAGIFGALYSIFVIGYFISIMTTGSSSDQASGVIATAIVTPHLLLVVLGSVFLLLGFFLRKTWAALTGSIVFCGAAVIFLVYAVFCLPSIVLGFVGFANQKKILGSLDKEQY